MRERTAQFSAGGIAVVLIGAVAAISRRNYGPPVPPKLVHQAFVHDPEKGYASVELSFLPPQRIPKPDPDETESEIEYRVVDRHGRNYVTGFAYRDKPFKIAVPRTYAHPIEEPKLEMLLDGELLASLPLADFPSPALRPLKAKNDSRIKAFLVRRTLPGNASGDLVAVFRPGAPLAKDETWEINLLETNIAYHELAKIEPSLSYEDSSEYVFDPGFAQDIEAARIKVSRFRRRTLSEDVRVPNLRLKQIDGEAVVDLRTPRDVPNRLGIRLALKTVPPSPGLFLAQPDPQVAFLGLKTEGTQCNIQRPGEAEPNEYLLGWRKGGFAKPRFFAQLLGPMPEELGLTGLVPFTTPGSSTAKSPLKPLRKEPFDLRLRLRKVIWQKFDTFETTVPVESRLTDTQTTR